MAISCLGFNTIALFSLQIFKIDDASVNANQSLVIVCTQARGLLASHAGVFILGEFVFQMENL